MYFYNDATAEVIPDASPVEIFDRIFNGGMPQVIADGIDSRASFYDSYVRTYLERDVRDLAGDINVLKSNSVVPIRCV